MLHSPSSPFWLGFGLPTVLRWCSARLDVAARLDEKDDVTRGGLGSRRWALLWASVALGCVPAAQSPTPVAASNGHPATPTAPSSKPPAAPPPPPAIVPSAQLPVVRVAGDTVLFDGQPTDELTNGRVVVARKLAELLDRRRRETEQPFLTLEVDENASGKAVQGVMMTAALHGWSQVRLQGAASAVLLRAHVAGHEIHPSELQLPDDVLSVDVLQSRVTLWRTLSLGSIVASRNVRSAPTQDYARALVAECPPDGNCNPLVLRHVFTTTPFIQTAQALGELARALAATNERPLQVLLTIWEPDDAHFLADALRPRVRVLPLDDENKISRKLLDVVLGQGPDYFRGCYAQALSRNPKLRGLASLSFELDSQGSPVSGRVAPADFRDHGLAQCLSDQIRRLRFPVSDSPRVSCNVYFEPSKN